MRPNIRRARLGILALVGVVTWACIAVSAGAATTSGGTSTRTITDAQSGETVIVSNEGQCGKTTAQLESPRLSDVGVEHDFTLAVDSKCDVSVGRPATVAASAAGLPTSPEQGSATSTGSTQSAAPATGGVIYGNIIHSSQTLQDVVNIDIAKYQYGHDRVWDNVGYSYFKTSPWWMYQSTSVSWNHNTGNPASLGFNSTWTYSSAAAAGIAAFHSDFLWCNFQPGQNFQLTTGLYSYWNGAYAGNYYQSRFCSGTHMATATKANTSAGAFN